jgi:hypothetical protein
LRVHLGVDERRYSPAVCEKLVRAGANEVSYRAASEALQHLAELDVAKMQVARVTQEVGEELAATRDERVALHRRGELASECDQPPPPIACVETDGGRMLTRACDSGRGVHEPQWKEDKVACLWRMEGPTFESDPHPQLPRCFQDEQHVRDLARGLHGHAGPAPAADQEEGEQAASADAVPAAEESAEGLLCDEASPEEPRPRWQPKRVWRTCVATLQDVHAFGWMVAAEAQRRGFFQSQRQVFLGDGAHENWTVHKTHFPHFTAVLDFVHVVGYLFAAARAVTGSRAARWEQYLDWATAAWQGHVDDIIADLERWRQILGDPPESVSETDPREIIRRTLGYLRNNRDRMNYPTYRTQGLPTTSALVESLIKQFNRRVKGTEKSWNRPEGAEAILQAKAALLSDGDPLRTHLKHRPRSPWRPYRQKCG